MLPRCMPNDSAALTGRLPFISRAWLPTNESLRQGRVQRLGQESERKLFQMRDRSIKVLRPSSTLLYQSEIAESRVEQTDFIKCGFAGELKRDYFVERFIIRDSNTKRIWMMQRRARGLRELPEGLIEQGEEQRKETSLEE